MTYADVPLTTEKAWGDGVWVRHRTHPTPRSTSGRVTVEPWHLVASEPLDIHDRLATVCRKLRYGLMWPGGLGAFEVARPNGHESLPGVVCSRCVNYRPVENAEHEVPITDIDLLADRVATRLVERAEEFRASTERTES